MSIQIKINNGNKLMDISFDIYGNLYLHDGNNDNNGNNTYQVNITGKNIPYCELGDYNIINKYEHTLGTFSLLDKENSLKTKVKKKIDEEVEYNSDDEYDLEGDNTIDYYPEDSDYVYNDDIVDNDDLIDEYNVTNYGYDNLKFEFWSNSISNPISIYNRCDGDIMSLYDVYIYENSNLIFKSNSSDNSSIYRFRININGYIYFRPVGYPEELYEIILTEDNKLTFIKQ